MEHFWKACVGETQSWAQIPSSLPSKLHFLYSLLRAARKMCRASESMTAMRSEPPANKWNRYNSGPPVEVSAEFTLLSSWIITRVGSILRRFTRSSKGKRGSITLHPAVPQTNNVRSESTKSFVVRHNHNGAALFLRNVPQNPGDQLARL